MDTGDTTWVLISTALVFLMTPALALFYGGMARAKGVLNMMMMSLISAGIVTIIWVAYGFSLAFGAKGNALIGDGSYLGFGEVMRSLTMVNGSEYQVPLIVFAMFQLMFAIITPALISGAIADRTKFVGWSLFVALWVTMVYFPVAHWVFDFGDADGNHAGWLAHLGVLDFAGGTAVHINAGAAGLALALVLGKRQGWPHAQFKPHNLPLTLLGAGLLWFGWFGFNAGSALGANAVAGLALLNTQAATAAAVVGWLVVEKIRNGHPTSLGAASGAVAGLVAITPACAFIAPWAALVLGLLAGGICAVAVSLKYRAGFDDALDVVGIHLVGGIIGCLFIGIFATERVNVTGAASVNGLFYGGGWSLLGKQLIGVLIVMVYSFVVTAVLGVIINKTVGLRLSPEEEEGGIDLAEHAETGYDFGSAHSGHRAGLLESTRHSEPVPAHQTGEKA